MKNAIIGFALNYSNQQIEPFLQSLNRTGFTGDLILYINNKSRIEHNASYRYNFVLINFEKKHKVSILKHKLLKIFSGISNNLIHKSRSQKAREIIKNSKRFSNDMLSYFYVNYYLATTRFILYYNFLHANQYDNVFFTDVSDVVFQDNIFKSVKQGKVIAFEEKKDVLIGDDEYNSQWVKDCCGPEAFDNIRMKNIYCAGTILADYAASMVFLKDFIQLMLSKQFKTKLLGPDQGFFNYMISYQQLQYFEKSENADVVFTVALNSFEDFLIKEEKIYYRQKPTNMPSVVHQYTRHQQILEFVNSLYS
jgi:hypothetical protein